MIIPVKDLEYSKSRLSSCLSPEERRLLTLAMFKDVLNSANESNIEEIVAISNDHLVLKTAKYFGAKTLEEKEQRGINYAIQNGIDYCVKKGANSILINPADMPLIKGGDLNRIIGLNKPPGVVLVPSHRFDGTNIMMLNPPNAIPVRYGMNSPRFHLREALIKGIYPKVLNIPNVSLDIDSPQDLFYLSKRDLNAHTKEFLLENKILPKLAYYL
ncbi:2-phospho-L-lactate guanylyltransferase [[Eubacterium] cellulosolvens]